MACATTLPARKRACRAGRPAGSGRIQSVSACQVCPRVRQVLEQLDEELQSWEQTTVCLEVRIGLMLTLHLLCRSGAKESDLVVQHLYA